MQIILFITLYFRDFFSLLDVKTITRNNKILCPSTYPQINSDKLKIYLGTFPLATLSSLFLPLQRNGEQYRKKMDQKKKKDRMILEQNI